MRPGSEVISRPSRSGPTNISLNIGLGYQRGEVYGINAIRYTRCRCERDTFTESAKRYWHRKIRRSQFCLQIACNILLEKIYTGVWVYV